LVLIQASFLLKMNTRSLLSGFLLVSNASMVAWGALPARPVTPGPMGTPVVSAATPTSIEPAYQSYKYMGDRYRDPFIPLTGNSYDAGSERAPQVSSLLLKGIVQDEKGRVAILSSGTSSFVLRAGRLYDGRNKPVKGLTGVIKAQSVVVVGSDRTVKELLLDKTAL